MQPPGGGTETEQAPDPYPTRFKKGQSGNPSGRPKKATLPGDLTLFERMISILPQEWKDADLRELAKSKPHLYAKLLELAGKVDQKPASRSADAPAPPDEKTADLLALIDDLLLRHGVQP